LGAGCHFTHGENFINTTLNTAQAALIVALGGSAGVAAARPKVDALAAMTGAYACVCTHEDCPDGAGAVELAIDEVAGQMTVDLGGESGLTITGPYVLTHYNADDRRVLNLGGVGAEIFTDGTVRYMIMWTCAKET
jgi:hypothetical protein